MHNNKPKVARRKENAAIAELVEVMKCGINAFCSETGAADSVVFTKHEDKIYTVKFGNNKFKLNIDVE